jgi:hypothetical protein
MIIGLTVNISEQITPELIAKAKENCPGETDFHPRQEYLAMTQDIITYILNRQDLFTEFFYDNLLFKLTSYNSDEDLEETTNFEPGIFENNILKAAEALGPNYVKFIKQLYQFHSDEEAKEAPGAQGSINTLAEAKIQKKEMPHEERDILIELLNLCLLDNTIVSVNFEPTPEEEDVLPIDGEPEEISTKKQKPETNLIIHEKQPPSLL